MAVVAIDIGGSGSRITADGRTHVAGPALTVADGRADHPELVGILARALGPVDATVEAVAVGAAGMVAFGDAKGIAAAVSVAWPGAAVVVASDAVTALLGAWDASGGGVVAAGTGVVAFATDFGSSWLRADGWGHVLGDDGGAAWIGRRGLSAALRAVDGRPGGSGRLLAAIQDRFGDPLRLPELLRSAVNPATLLAGYAPAVTAAAAAGDGVAMQIVDAAARELAETGLSVMRDPIPRRLALVGGLASDPAIADVFQTVVRTARPDIEAAVDTGSPLDGALRLARRAAASEALPQHPPYLSVFAPFPTIQH